MIHRFLDPSASPDTCYDDPEGSKVHTHKRTCRATLSGDGPKVTDPNPHFDAVFCENPRFPVPSKFLNFHEGGEFAKIGGFLRKSAFWAFSVTLGPSP